MPGQRIGWYAARLQAMSAPELAWRAAATITLPLRDRVGPTPRAPSWPDAPRLDRVDDDVRAAAAEVAAGRLAFWGKSIDVNLRAVRWHADPLDGVPLPNVSWRRWGRDAKPVWELHRLQHLVPLASGGDDAARRLALDHILDWIARNPVGTPWGWTSGYEAAHRIVTWTLAVPFLLDVARDDERIAIDNSFVAHVRFVAARPSRFSSANNHRLAELVGLLAAAQLGLGEWEPLWRELEQQVVAQTYEDGGGREQAGGYFLYVLEILYVAALLARARGAELGRVGERLRAMLAWLDAVADEEGEPPLVGDDAEDRMLRLEYFEPRRAELIAGRVAELLGVERERVQTSVLLPASGYAVFRGDGVHAVFDVGELGFGSLAAHGHADALAVIVRGRTRDSGTGSYYPADGRDAFRVTSAHNTVTIDGRSQAEPVGPHIWGRRFSVAIEGAGFADVDYVRGSHDGYSPAKHTRSVTRAGGVLVVLDRVQAPRPVTATLAWHPEAEVAVHVASVPESTAAEVDGPWSPGYRDVRTAPRRTWTARGTDVVFASVFGGEPRLTHQDGVTRVETGQVRLTERWVGPMIESGG